MKLKPLPPTWVIPIALESVALLVLETRLMVWSAGVSGFSVRFTEIPLWLKVCCTRWRIALSKLWICWEVG